MSNGGAINPDLADWLFPEDMQPDFTVETTLGAGRNCTVFDELRLIAYREVRAFKRDGSLDTFRARLERVAIGINTHFPEALRLSEVRSIVKSVAEWTWRHFSEEQFSARQALRGARRAAQMWAGHVGAEKTKPWDVDNISRATWYRRRRDALTKTMGQPHDTRRHRQSRPVQRLRGEAPRRRRKADEVP